MLRMVSFAVAPVYTLKITLLGTEPPVWRQVVVRGDIGLEDLHHAIQIAMGWTDSHLHQYHVGEQMIGKPDPNFGGSMKDEADFTLADVAAKKGAKFRYEYDFGDSWLHEIRAEKIEDDVPDHKHPICTDGARACPPEDVGGVWGFGELVQAMTNPKHKRRKEFIEWLGEPFNPEAFDLGETNGRLKKLKYRR